MTTEDILKRLADGNARFVADKLTRSLQNRSRRELLIDNQKPFAVVLSCVDSRVIPELAFDTGLGELVVVRVGGNVANKSSVASIEFAVKYLGTKVIVVLAHENCKAVAAACDGGKHSNNIEHLLTYIAPAINSAPDGATHNDVAKINARLTVADLTGKSEVIKNAVENEEVKIVSAYYNLVSGKVDFY